MVAEAFRAPRRADADRPARRHRPDRRARSRRCCCAGPTRRASASSSPTTSGCSSPCILIVVGAAVARDLRADASIASACRAARYYALMLFCARRHDADGDGDGPAGHLPRARGAVAGGLRADRASAATTPPAVEGGAQILPARRVLERVLPLRHRVHLRRDRQHAARPRSAA